MPVHTCIHRGGRTRDWSLSLPKTIFRNCRERPLCRSAGCSEWIEAPRRIRRNLPHVILSEQSESKDLRTCHLHRSLRVRRSFDFGLRPSLRMTDFRTAAPSGGGAETDTPGGVSLRASFSFFVAVETWCCVHRRAVGLRPPLGLIVLRTLYHPTFYTGITA